MKKFITISGYIASIFIIIGMLLKFNHWPGASLLLLAGFLFMILFFLPSFGYNLAYNFTEKKSKTAGVFGSVLFILIALAMIFKIQHWAGTGLVLVLQFFVLCFLVLPTLMIIKIKSATSSAEKWMQFFWYLSLISMSLGYIFKINHLPLASQMMMFGELVIAFGYFPLAIKLYNNDENRSKLYNRFIIVVSCLIYAIFSIVGVTGTILGAFVNMNDGLIQTSNYLQENNNKLFENFKEGNTSESEKTYLQAKKVKDLSDDLINHIEKMKIFLMNRVNSSMDDSITLQKVDSKDNYDTPTSIIIGDPENPNKGAWSGFELKTKIMVYKQDLLSMFDEKEAIEIGKTIGLNTDDVYSENEERKILWEFNNFNRNPLAGVISVLSKVQSDVRIAESEIMDLLYKKFPKPYKFDNTIMRGDTILIYKGK